LAACNATPRAPHVSSHDSVECIATHSCLVHPPVLPASCLDVNQSCQQATCMDRWHARSHQLLGRPHVDLQASGACEATPRATTCQNPCTALSHGDTSTCCMSFAC